MMVCWECDFSTSTNLRLTAKQGGLSRMWLAPSGVGLLGILLVCEVLLIKQKNYNNSNDNKKKDNSNNRARLDSENHIHSTAQRPVLLHSHI